MTDGPEVSTRRTPLHDVHLELGARLIPFAGFEMPIQYTGIIAEHLAVRQRVGIFDVSHMGEVFATGPNAFAFVQQLVTNDVSRLADGRAMYTVMCMPDGGIVDDLLVYRFSAERYMLVVNAACRASDLDWMRSHNEAGAAIEDRSDTIALIAVQGPKALETVANIAPQSVTSLRQNDVIEARPGSFFDCRFAAISHTGYTGERGVEIYCDADRATAVWEAVMQAGDAFGIQPAGLGARDTLRLEAGFCLYGNDITRGTNPYEAGLAWIVKPDKGEFVGRDTLRRIREEGASRRLVAFVAADRGIPRAGDAIHAGGEVVGVVTSGTQSPVLRQGIGMGYVPNETRFTEPEAELSVMSRNRPLAVTVRRPPLHVVS